MFTADFIDPSGHAITLRAPNEGELRQLVAKKLAQGWRQALGKPVAPLELTQVLAPGPVVAPPPEPVVIDYGPSLDERRAAVDEALSASEDSE